jgi:hypothetical protein
MLAWYFAKDFDPVNSSANSECFEPTIWIVVLWNVSR